MIQVAITIGLLSVIGGYTIKCIWEDVSAHLQLDALIVLALIAAAGFAALMLTPSALLLVKVSLEIGKMLGLQ